MSRRKIEKEENRTRLRVQNSKTRVNAGGGVGGEEVEEGDVKKKEQPQELHQQPEEERPVPGMNGLTVEFVRDIFSICKKDEKRRYDDDNNANVGAEVDDVEEEIYSDRLPSGRYVWIELHAITHIDPRPRISHNI